VAAADHVVVRAAGSLAPPLDATRLFRPKVDYLQYRYLAERAGFLRAIPPPGMLRLLTTLRLKTLKMLL
jgi:hypothetical protein